MVEMFDDIEKIARMHVNDADAEQCRLGLQKIIKYINNTRGAYALQHEKNKYLWGR